MAPPSDALLFANVQRAAFKTELSYAMHTCPLLVECLVHDRMDFCGSPLHPSQSVKVTTSLTLPRNWGTTTITNAQLAAL